MRLADHQRRIIDEALSKDEKGNYKYATIVYSAPKKSGKSALTSAVALYVAYHTPNSFVACLANDGSQANDRLYGPIYTNFRLHRQLGGIFKDATPKIGEVTLENFTKIRAVPCDAAGEAGAQPLATFWSELWGFNTPKKSALFVEMTVPPTLYGRAFRWIESYAGYSGESEILEQIYETGFSQGEPHPEFDLEGRHGKVVRVNKRARMFCYWDTEPRMPWQNDDYYQEEAQILPAAEFERLHRNLWVSPVSAFVEQAWWKACERLDLPPLRDGDLTPVVVGIDMAVTGDCAALVAVTRDPANPATGVAVRGVRILNPKRLGGTIDQETVVRPIIEEWANKWNVVCWVYDPREMAKLAQDMTREGFGWFKPFGQVQPRTIADKQLRDMIMARQVSWNRETTEGNIGRHGGDEDSLFRHIIQAGADTSSDAYRISKLSPSAKIDGAVALSQAAHIAMKLLLDNRETNVDDLIEKLRKREISLEEFSNLVQKKNQLLQKAQI